jgi:hypothetical protein
VLNTWRSVSRFKVSHCVRLCVLLCVYSVVVGFEKGYMILYSWYTHKGKTGWIDSRDMTLDLLCTGSRHCFFPSYL